MWWSYLLALVGIYGLWLVGRHDRRGWMVGLFAQLLWIIYATVTKQYGFYIGSVAFGFINYKNLRAWPKEDGRRNELDRRRKKFGY